MREGLDKKHGSWYLKPTQMPVIVVNFFESIRAKHFVFELDQLLKHKDCFVSEGVLGCMFEENFNAADYAGSPEDELCQPFEGVRFSLRVSWRDPLESETVDVPTFMKYLLEACEKFLHQYPQYRDEVIEVFHLNHLAYP